MLAAPKTWMPAAIAHRISLCRTDGTLSNRPWRVAVTAQTVAEVHGVTPEEVAAATTATATRAFGIPCTYADDTADAAPGA